MIGAITKFLFEDQGKSHAEDGRHSDDELHMAAAGLLVEAALLDGEFSDAERNRISQICMNHFELPAAETDALLERAEQQVEDSVDIYGFLRVLMRNFDPGEQLKLVEMLWEVVYADGEVHPLEAALIRRIVGMMAVTDRESGEARKRAQAKTGYSG